MKEWFKNSQFKRGLRRSAVEFGVPSYLLNENMQYVDWNSAFDELFARELGIHKGTHVMSAIPRLENRAEVLKIIHGRFKDGVHPMSDTYRLLLRTKRYGLVEMQKISTQLRDEKGQPKGRVVTWNILNAESMAQLWEDLAVRFNREVIWGAFFLSSAYLMPHCKGYKELLSNIVGLVGKSETILQLGIDTGHLSHELVNSYPSAEISGLESNQSVLEQAKRCLLDNGHSLKSLSLRKGQLEDLSEFESESIDTIVSLDGFHRIVDKEQGIAEAARVLRPGGTLVLTFLDLELSIEDHVKGLQESLPSNADLVTTLDAYGESLVLAKGQMVHNKEDISILLDSVGIEIVESKDSLFYNSRTLLVGRKKDK